MKKASTESLKANASLLSGTPNLISAFNTIRASASTEYQNRIPVATQENIAQIGNAMLQYDALPNEFLHALVNRIGRVIIQSKSYLNPLREFKKGVMEFGDTIEEIFVNAAKAIAYTPEPAEGNLCDVFEVTLPDVQSRFHRINRRDTYPVTINNDLLRTAFLSWQGIESLIANIIDSLYTGDEYDEFILMKHLVYDYGNKGKFYQVHVDGFEDSDTYDQRKAKARTISAQMRAYSNLMTFMSQKYNYAGVLTHTPLRDQIVLINPIYDAFIDVDSLADAFQMDKADFLARRILIDDFGGLDDTVAILCDTNWFMVVDAFFQFTEAYNARHLYWNYFYHHFEILSTSEFANAIQFTTAPVTPPVEPEVTSVTVAPKTASVNTGATQQFTATVEVTGGALKNLIWDVTGTETVTSTITNEGLLTVGANEANTTLTVKATSTVDSTKSDTAVVTVVRPS